MRKITTVAVLLTLGGCASGPEANSAPRPSGALAPCPNYASYDTARLPDGRGLLQALDSIAAVPGAASRPSDMKTIDRGMSELLGVTITHPARLRPSDRDRLRRLFEETYPPELRRAGRSGRATLALLVDASGTVRETRLVRSSGYPSMDLAAATLLKQAAFDPAFAGTCSVPSVLILPVTYQLATPADPGRRP
jgi:TonB family protein